MKDMTELETVKITVQLGSEEPETMETKSLLVIMVDHEKMDVAERGWNVSPDLLAMHLANMEQAKLEEGEAATYDAMQKLPKWRRWLRRQKRKYRAKELRKWLGL